MCRQGHWPDRGGQLADSITTTTAKPKTDKLPQIDHQHHQHHNEPLTAANCTKLELQFDGHELQQRLTDSGNGSAESTDQLDPVAGGQQPAGTILLQPACNCSATGQVETTLFALQLDQICADLPARDGGGGGGSQLCLWRPVVDSGGLCLIEPAAWPSSLPPGYNSAPACHQAVSPSGSCCPPDSTTPLELNSQGEVTNNETTTDESPLFAHHHHHHHLPHHGHHLGQLDEFCRPDYLQVNTNGDVGGGLASSRPAKARPARRNERVRFLGTFKDSELN